MVNSEFIKDLSKGLQKQSVNSELTPGATPRRYEPEVGVKKHNERIHRETSYVDKYKNLPFSFSKPAFGGTKKSTIKFCANCKTPVDVHTNAIGVICRSCNTYSKLLEEI